VDCRGRKLNWSIFSPYKLVLCKSIVIRIEIRIEIFIVPISPTAILGGNTSPSTGRRKCRIEWHLPAVKRSSLNKIIKKCLKMLSYCRLNTISKSSRIVLGCRSLVACMICSRIPENTKLNPNSLLRIGKRSGRLHRRRHLSLQTVRDAKEGD
jgi:hypothetical protein